MKYEFITLSEDFKNSKNTIYTNDNGNKCIDLTTIIEKNNNLKFPIAIFINGVLLESESYQFKNKTIIITDKSYPIYNSDRIYMLVASTNLNNAGYISQYICKKFNIHDANSIVVDAGILKLANKEIIGIIINGVLYGKETFSIEYNQDLGYTEVDEKGNVKVVYKDRAILSKYVPENENDDVSFLIFEKDYN